MHQFSSFLLGGSWLLASMSLACVIPAQQVRAEIVVSGFEETPKGLNPDGVYLGEPDAPTTFQSGKVEFSNDGVFHDGIYTFWSGIGYSQRTTNTGGEFWENGNDLIAVPSSGAGGSATWGVIYQDGTLSTQQGYIFDSLAITNTLWTYTTMTTEDPFIPANTPFTDGDFFSVTFTNPISHDSLEVPLADFRGAAKDHFILTDWFNVDLSKLNATKLDVTFQGSRNSQWGLVTPAYAAIDNVAASSISAVPEPSSLALIMAASSAGIWFQWRKRRSATQAEPTPQEIA